MFGLLCLWIIFSVCDYLFEIYNVKIPAGLFGISVLFLWFVINRCVAKPIQAASKPLLTHMSLFFLPAIVGIMNYSDLLYQHALALILAIVFATLFSLLLTALIAQWLIKSSKPNHQNNQN